MAHVKWVQDKTFLGRRRQWPGGGDVERRRGPGVSPMQMLLLGLGGCAMVDVLLILEKQRQPVSGRGCGDARRARGRGRTAVEDD